MTINQIVQAIDQFYKDHPDQLETPVMKVIWNRDQTEPQDGDCRPSIEVNMKPGTIDFGIDFGQASKS